MARGALRALIPSPRHTNEIAWLSACGAKLAEAEHRTAERYVATLALPAAPVLGVATWREAAATAQRDDWSRAWWEAEEDRRKRLHRRAAELVGETRLLAHLTEVMEANAAPAHAAAQRALAASGTVDETLARVAAGAIAQACHQFALASAAGCSDDAFIDKHRLYAGGRWLLGIFGGRCLIF